MSFRALETRIRESLRREQLMATLSGCFGALAALLATIGLYGVLSYTVARRRHEIGIRMALGAGRRDIISMIVREAGVLVAVGIALGGGLAIAAANAARTLLFGVTPSDPTSLLLAAMSFRSRVRDRQRVAGAGRVAAAADGRNSRGIIVALKGPRYEYQV